MDWIDKWNEALEMLEKSLTAEISLDDIARTACCTTFHFQRMFSYLADMPLSEYIRRRKMTKAAFDLQRGAKVNTDAVPRRRSHGHFKASTASHQPKPREKARP